MARSSFERLHGGVPRVLVLMEKHRGETPLGRKPVSKATQRRRAEPIVAGVADGRIPLDETTTRMVVDALEHEYKRLKHG